MNKISKDENKMKKMTEFYTAEMFKGMELEDEEIEYIRNNPPHSLIPTTPITPELLDEVTDIINETDRPYRSVKDWDVVLAETSPVGDDQFLADFGGAL